MNDQQKRIAALELLLAKSLELLERCYHAGHREGWQDGETNSEVFDAVNNFLNHMAKGGSDERRPAD